MTVILQTETVFVYSFLSSVNHSTLTCLLHKHKESSLLSSFDLGKVLLMRARLSALVVMQGVNVCYCFICETKGRNVLPPDTIMGN